MKLLHQHQQNKVLHCSITNRVSPITRNLWITKKKKRIARLSVLCQMATIYLRRFQYCPSCHGEFVLRSFSLDYYCFCLCAWHCSWLTLTLALQCEKATPRGEDCQHLPKGPADETETEWLGEETRELALLEAHSAQHRRRGGCGCRPACVLDIHPMIHCGSLIKTPTGRYFSKWSYMVMCVSEGIYFVRSKCGRLRSNDSVCTFHVRSYQNL